MATGECFPGIPVCEKENSLIELSLKTAFALRNTKAVRKLNCSTNKSHNLGWDDATCVFCTTNVFAQKIY